MHKLLKFTNVKSQMALCVATKFAELKYDDKGLLFCGLDEMMILLLLTTATHTST